ncbi:MAG: GDP-mannose 4,6-dehydratase [Roseomonas sp.]|nr:GDP-mannose 4,6-dehydratase [Roseomonas sp.]MCA3328734.1 GDP-mannose 4,6-dehydratase [Roseomonas sp.]MCA3333075.1 GDP-mannose 4,6-dehydratase [Roseomonas sp.]MCA3335852.1 GDP-mannose 4,6-dehydratase [Roseomonas sp.]MCA3345737.1 GDP-mannose 4,6-dehydratase [Roseomonas sp.]
MRIALTGAAGFVGPYVVEGLRRQFGNDAEIVATSKFGGQYPQLGMVRSLDITDASAVAVFLDEFKPTHILHLAGIAAVTASDTTPDLAWAVHLHGTLNLARAIMQDESSCCLINIGSGLIYGASARSGLPLDEGALLAPMEEYSASKAAADLALGALGYRGLKNIRLRPFNHSGPGQSDSFALPAFAKQLARIEAGLAPPVIRVGDLDARRDFLDVRDVAQAYVLAIMNSPLIPSGTPINIAAGVAVRIGDILEQLIRKSNVRISVERDPSRMRPSETPIIVGSNERAQVMLGWRPMHPFEETVSNVLNYWRQLVREQPERYAGNNTTDK